MADLMSKHLFEPEEVMAYLDGQLSSEQALLVASHLKECTECAILAHDLGSVSAKMSEWLVPSEWLHMNWALTADVRKPERKWGWNWKWATAGACVALAILFAVPISLNLYRVQPLPQAQMTSALTARQADAPPPPQFARAVQQVGGSLEEAEQRPAPRQFDAARRSKTFLDSARTKAPMVARTFQLVMVTKEFAKVRPELDAILKRHQGYIGQLSISGADNAHNLEATLRIPANQLDAVIVELKKFGRVDVESQGGEELTQQYTDLEARLNNARNSEQRLSGILRERTGRLSDVLDVEREIERVRGEIESMEATRKSMANRVDFATINLTVREDYRAQLNVNPDSTFARFRNAAVEGYRSMLEGLITLLLVALSYGPTLLVWAAILFIPVRWAWKRRAAIGRGAVRL